MLFTIITYNIIIWHVSYDIITTYWLREKFNFWKMVALRILIAKTMLFILTSVVYQNQIFIDRISGFGTIINCENDVIYAYRCCTSKSDIYRSNMTYLLYLIIYILHWLHVYHMKEHRIYCFFKCGKSSRRWMYIIWTNNFLNAAKVVVAECIQYEQTTFFKKNHIFI